MLVKSAFSLATLFSCAFADVSFSGPSAGQSVTGDSIDIELADGAGSPSISDLKSFTLQLCAGGNTADTFTPIITFTDAPTDFSSASFSVTIPDLTVGGTTKNAYFLRTISVAKEGGTVTNYSNRFTLASMKGQFSAVVQKGLASVTGTDGPKTEDGIANNAGGAGAGADASGTAVDSGVFATPYTEQSGPIRYAPMAKVVGSSITKKGGPSAQYPTSAYEVYKTNMQNADLPLKTVTADFTFKVSSKENTEPAASGPASDMQKFLNRWKD